MLMAIGQALAPESIPYAIFAPELIAGSVALVLLLLAVAGRRRGIVGVPVALAGIAVGAQMLRGDLLFPGLVVVGVGAGIGVASLGLGAAPKVLPSVVAGMGLVGALALTVWQSISPMVIAENVVAGVAPDLISIVGFDGSVVLDGISLYTRLTVYLTALLVLPLGHAYLRDRQIARPEFEPLLVLSAVGMALLGAAGDLITLFVALEILSIALYILSGLARRDRRSQEAAVKYFVTGAVASAILLYGMALLYVSTGALELSAIGASLQALLPSLETSIVLPVIAMVMIIVGLGFKVALVPFHLWTPDVYEGAPTNVTAFMAAATKAAGFAAVLRVFYIAFGPLAYLWAPVIAVLAAASMLYGAFVALVQTDVKRILAYSAIAHAGYAAIGVASASGEGISATLWYLLTYAVSTLAAFGCLMALERTNQRAVTLGDLRGLGSTSPATAWILALSMLSLAGIPPTVGFVGKLEVFRAGVGAGLTWLVVIGVVSSVVSAFFYLRIMGSMFLEEPAEGAQPAAYAGGWNVAVNLAAVLIVLLGLLPAFLVELASRAMVG